MTSPTTVSNGERDTLRHDAPPRRRARRRPRLWPLLLPTALLAAGLQAQELSVPLFISASDSTNSGFVRIINHSNVDGKIRVTAIDDSGRRFDSIGIGIGARQTLHFNSGDLENGNPAKGIDIGVGPGEGDWRLEIDVDEDVDRGLQLEALAFVRARDGFLTSVHDLTPGKTRHRVPVFNPASNMNQVSLLRLINPGKTDVDIQIVGLDDKGRTSPVVEADLRPNETLTFSAQELELGGHHRLDGALGNGAGKWQLFVSSSETIQVMSIMRSPTGHLSNLSTQTSAEEHDAPAGGSLEHQLPTRHRQAFGRAK